MTKKEKKTEKSQASVIIRTRLRAQTTRTAPSPKESTNSSISPQIQGKLLNTLVKLKNSGLQEQTFKISGFYLKHLVENADLSKPKSGYKSIYKTHFLFGLLSSFYLI